MGLENSWNSDEDLTANQPANFVIPLPPVSSVEVNTYIDTSVDNGPFSEIDCLFSPMEQGSDNQEDTLCEEAEAGVCGLRNLGNTCFVSAGVQCLVATSPLAQALLGRATTPPASALAGTTGETATGSLTAELVRLAKSMWSGAYSSLQPAGFKASLSARYPQFNDYRQHDCQEFLALLLDALHEQLNTAVSKDFACQVESREFSDEIFCKEASTSKSWLMETTSRQNTNVFGESTSQLLKKEISVSDIIMRLEDASPPNESHMNNTTVTHENNQSYNNMIGSGSGLSGGSKCSSEGLSLLNNAVGRLSGLGDILKEAKTSNVNVLATHMEANNEIRFDSDKYPRIERRLRREGFSFNSFHQNNPTTQGKRCKSQNLSPHNHLSVGFCSDDDEDEGWGSGSDGGLDLKRVKLRDDEEGGATMMAALRRVEKNRRAELERLRQHHLLEKNYRMEYERKQAEKQSKEEEEEEGKLAIGGKEGEEMTEICRTSGEGEEEGEKHWQRHLAANKSVIVDTFQGQFKSTVVCSTCNYVSVTYEPFMYLSVPLPNALKKQICITYVSAGAGEVVEMNLEVGRTDTVGSLRKEVMKKLGRDKEGSGSIAMAHVLNHHITKILDDSYLVRDLNDTNRSLYAFEVVTVENEQPTTSKPQMDSDNEGLGEELSGERSCTICLEEKEANMRQHVGCSCTLCDICITASCQHHGGERMECPLCRKEANPEKDFIPLQPSSKITIRILNMPVVFRIDEIGDGNNNQKTVCLFGHPALLRVPSRVDPQLLHSTIASLVPYPLPYRLLLVDGQGTHCSRCMYGSHCSGCEIKSEDSGSPFVLFSGDTLGVAFPSTPPPDNPLYKASLHQPSHPPPPQPPLTLYDCIRAFSQSEVLDEQNPWYCPRCRRNQCATKTLSIWRYPEYLIVYLKRFIFHDQMSTKLEDKIVFPLCGLKLAPNVPLYDLYACVCHSGGVSAGHYTTYTQHPMTNEWHYFNDSYVTSQAPQEDDYSTAYILFYKKQGLTVPNLEIEPEVQRNPIVLTEIN